MAKKKVARKAHTKKSKSSLHPLHIVIATFSTAVILLVIMFGCVYNISVHNTAQAAGQVQGVQH